MGVVWWTEVPGVSFDIAEMQLVRFNFFVFWDSIILFSSVAQDKRPGRFQRSLLLGLSFLTIEEAGGKQFLLNLFLAWNTHSITASCGPI